MQRIYTRREKLFGVGRPVPLDREAKCKIMVAARAKMRRQTPGRAWGDVTAKAMSVVEAILWGFHNSRTGLAIPSYEAIAKRAGCARSTVAKAIRALEAAGILTWCIRLRRVRVPSSSGWRWRVLRSSNSYRFTVSAGDVRTASIPSVCSKSDDRTRTMNQGSIQIDAPSRRGSVADEPGLLAALNRLGRAVQSRVSEIPMG